MVSARGLGKRFKLYARPIDRVLEWCSAGSVVKHESFWALRGIDLDIAPGECVGIIGRNGSGKSTLLKLMSGALTPTEGTARAHGRVYALLELGTGFNRQLTGRQNIAFAASMLGIERDYIKAREEEIVAFADLGGFIDQPVRLYSSGMTSRLAFSLFAFLDPDVLMIDEVLSVGDEAFKARCFDLIERRIARGRSVVYVSHALRTMVRLCDRVLWLDSGRAERIGPPTEVVNAFVGRHRTGADPAAQQHDRPQRVRGARPAPSEGGATLRVDRIDAAPGAPEGGCIWEAPGTITEPETFDIRRAWIETPLGDARDTAPAGLAFVLALEIVGPIDGPTTLEVMAQDPEGHTIGGVRARIDAIGDGNGDGSVGNAPISTPCVLRLLSGSGFSPGEHTVRLSVIDAGAHRVIGPNKGITIPVVGVAPTPGGIVVFRKVTLADGVGDAPDHAGD